MLNMPKTIGLFLGLAHSEIAQSLSSGFSKIERDRDPLISYLPSAWTERKIHKIPKNQMNQFGSVTFWDVQTDAPIRTMCGFLLNRSRHGWHARTGQLPSFTGELTDRPSSTNGFLMVKACFRLVRLQCK